MERIPDNKKVKIRKFCYKMHLKRLYLLKNVRGSSGGEMVACPASPLPLEACSCAPSDSGEYRQKKEG